MKAEGMSVLKKVFEGSSDDALKKLSGMQTGESKTITVDAKAMMLQILSMIEKHQGSVDRRLDRIEKALNIKQGG